MRCANHPNKNAVALIRKSGYSIGVCVNCLKLYQEEMFRIVSNLKSKVLKNEY